MRKDIDVGLAKVSEVRGRGRQRILATRLAVCLLGFAACTSNDGNSDIREVADNKADPTDAEVLENEAIIPVSDDVTRDGSCDRRLFCYCQCADGKGAIGSVEIADDADDAVYRCRTECGADCSYEELGKCTGFATPPILAWVAAVDGDSDEEPPMNVVVSGIIEEVGSGFFDAPGLGSGRERVLGNFPIDEGALRWFRVKDASDARWIVQYALEGVEPFEIGDQVAVDFTFIDVGWRPPEGSIHVLRGNSQAFWIAQGSSISELNPPGGLLVNAATPLCRGSDVCGSWILRSMVVYTKTGAEHTEVPVGESREFSQGIVTNGALTVEASWEGGCCDWTQDLVLVGIAWKATAGE